MNMILLLLSILGSAVGQYYYKKAADVSAGIDNNILYFIDMMKHIWLWLALFIYGVSFLLYMIALKELDISFARPLTSLGYILTYVMAIFFLGEDFTVRRLIATILITVGVMLMK